MLWQATGCIQVTEGPAAAPAQSVSAEEGKRVSDRGFVEPEEIRSFFLAGSIDYTAEYCGMWETNPVQVMNVMVVPFTDQGFYPESNIKEGIAQAFNTTC